MKSAIYIYKLFKFLLFILSYSMFSFLILLLTFFQTKYARKLLIKNISIHSNIALKIFGIKVKCSNAINILDSNYLIVSNHHSYLDIFVISSLAPACFVTSLEMKATPFLGKLCELGGCIFVDRNSKKSILAEIKNITEVLKKNLNVVVFPEARSSDGEALLTFRRPLIQAAINAKKNLLPICINYSKISGEVITKANKDKVFWYGEMTFFPHFLEIMKINSIEIDVLVLPIIKIDSHLSKNELTEMSYNIINENFIPITN